jgi:ABC-type bacteriocin/lantibiotic exporter with double-glycine peptidase domain
MLKNFLDTICNAIKDVEEFLSPNAVVIPGIKRSVQLDGYSCGAQCAYAILKYYGKARSINAIKKALGTSIEEGTDTGPILRLLRKRGLRVSIKKDATLRNIYEAIDNQWPILISVDDGDHWVVIYGYSEDGIYILDPALKSLLCEWSVVEFGGRWDEAWIGVVKN